MLVEPHNTYIWLLLEGGVASLVGFLTSLILPFTLRDVARRERLRFGVVLATFLIIGVFDAIILINAASAFWWSILLISYEVLAKTEEDEA